MILLPTSKIQILLIDFYLYNYIFFHTSLSQHLNFCVFSKLGKYIFKMITPLKQSTFYADKKELSC